MNFEQLFEHYIKVIEAGNSNDVFNNLNKL